MRIDVLSKKSGRTDKQIDAHFLCGNCENNFSKYGEARISKVWATHFGFPMLELLKGIQAISSNSKRRIYEPAQLSNGLGESLYYFALSIVWRAIEWPQVNAGVESCKDSLTLHQLADVSHFLLNGSGHVNDVFVVVDVNTCFELNGVLSMPALARMNDVKMIQFDILGLRFMVFIGPAFPPEINTLQTTYNSHLLITSSDHSKGKFAMQVARYLCENNIN